MDYSNILKQYQIDEELLISYGFISNLNCNNKTTYIYRKGICNDEFYVEVNIDSKNFIVKIYDTTFNDEYNLISVSSFIGGFVGKVKEAVEEIVNDIIKRCLIDYNQRERIIDYIKHKYEVIPSMPFNEKTTFAFRITQSNKWFALMMNINHKLLDESINTIDKVDVINLKIENAETSRVIDNKSVFKAYHMNKKKWISVLLDNSLEDKVIEKLVDRSYDLVKKTNNIHEWIIPVNPKFYDVDKAFDENNTLLWKQSSSFKVDDIVYLYFASPVSAIRYKCIVLEINIPFDYEDKNLKMNKVMNIKMIRKYSDNKVSFKVMKENGVTSIRGPRYMTKELLSVINETYE